jgi:hypothetical protein
MIVQRLLLHCRWRFEFVANEQTSTRLWECNMRIGATTEMKL